MPEPDISGSEGVEFKAETRMSGTNFSDGLEVRKGAVDAIKEYVKKQGGH
ncbi:potassium-transporting ATPase B chain [Bacillus methanolicus PB1]|uniref:Potassium-transporting ATPase B chain n=1 Tax=Bacillus methanolicus PB1 TaxID=997296 RepID=I3E0A2_BACMT|nr:potassium-transporting ATPase B chain [Bacillus methanolicus PB1]